MRVARMSLTAEAISLTLETDSRAHDYGRALTPRARASSPLRWRVSPSTGITDVLKGAVPAVSARIWTRPSTAASRPRWPRAGGCGRHDPTQLGRRARPPAGRRAPDHSLPGRLRIPSGLGHERSRCAGSAPVTYSPADPARPRAAPVRRAALDSPADPAVRRAAHCGGAGPPWRTLGSDTRSGCPCCLRGYAPEPRDQRCGTAGRSARECLWAQASATSSTRSRRFFLIDPSAGAAPAGPGGGGAWRGVVTMTVGMRLEQGRPGAVIPAREADGLIASDAERSILAARIHGFSPLQGQIACLR
jgi:hypothetical protein